jgi:hypothetical protein
MKGNEGNADGIERWDPGHRLLQQERLRLWTLKASANRQKRKVPEAGSEGSAVVWLAKDSPSALHSTPEPSFAGVFRTLA